MPWPSRLCGSASTLRPPSVGNPHVPTVLLHGETGTGKALVACIIHDIGLRAAGPCIDVYCSALAETMLEAELFSFEVGPSPMRSGGSLASSRPPPGEDCFWRKEYTIGWVVGGTRG